MGVQTSFKRAACPPSSTQPLRKLDWGDACLYPFAAQTMARATPVEPAVPSVTKLHGSNVPATSASSTICSATRSLMLPPGFSISAFARIQHPVAFDSDAMRTRGVSPTHPSTPDAGLTAWSACTHKHVACSGREHGMEAVLAAPSEWLWPRWVQLHIRAVQASTAHRTSCRGEARFATKPSPGHVHGHYPECRHHGRRSMSSTPSGGVCHRSGSGQLDWDHMGSPCLVQYPSQ